MSFLRPNDQNVKIKGLSGRIILFFGMFKDSDYQFER
jgi:hypothetical protein